MNKNINIQHNKVIHKRTRWASWYVLQKEQEHRAMKMNLKVQVALHLICTRITLCYVIQVLNSALISQYTYMQHW